MPHAFRMTLSKQPVPHSYLVGISHAQSALNYTLLVSELLESFLSSVHRFLSIFCSSSFDTSITMLGVSIRIIAAYVAFLTPDLKGYLQPDFKTFCHSCGTTITRNYLALCKFLHDLTLDNLNGNEIVHEYGVVLALVFTYLC